MVKMRSLEERNLSKENKQKKNEETRIATWQLF